jgi:hypothetical protein
VTSVLAFGLTNFRSIREEVSAQESQTRIDLTACYPLIGGLTARMADAAPLAGGAAVAVSRGPQMLRPAFSQ